MGDPVRVALLGCGTVGAEVARAMLDAGSAAALAEAAGATLELVGVAVAREGVPRDGLSPSLVTTDASALVATAPDVVVELIGGLGEVEGLVRQALEARCSVVTANKALLAARLRELSELAASREVDLLYEAAVAGAIPIVRVLRDSLASEPIQRVLGIVNGTTNFLLTTMAREGCELDEALATATALGLAERDPSADLDGHDAAQKAAILASLAFRAEVTDADVPRVGIAKVTLEDVDAARRMGHVVRLLAVAERVGARPTIAAAARLVPPGEVRSAFYLAIRVIDRPGVLAAVAQVFGDRGVSIRSMEQTGLGADARLVFLTHEAAAADLDATVADLGRLDAVAEVGAVLDVVGGEGS